MLLFLWLASWITLYCVGHPLAATVDLGVGAGVLLVSLVTGMAAVAAVYRKVKRS